MRTTITLGFRSRRTLAAVALTACAAAALTLAGTTAGPAGAVAPAPATATVADAGDESQDFVFPGADTLDLHDGSNKYITYGASDHGKNVPYSISGSGNTVATKPTIDGDAMPGGGGAWVKNGSGIWTPGAFYHASRYYLFYTAVKAGSDGQHCVGVASSSSPTSGFKAEATPIVCPSKANRWAIDADVTTGPSGAIWMVWRDGERAVGAESALSVMMLKFQDNGTVDRNSDPVVILRSDNLDWAHYQDGAGVTVIENPSAIYHGGSWYLFYSGNSWSTNYYSTGIAYCGPTIDSGLCSPMPGPARAYFSYSGPKAHLPDGQRLHGLPGNKRGPGAMDVYLARDGKPWVTWNYLTGDTGTGRKSRVGRLNITGSGASADFSVTLP
ncbi:MAG: family 43 glycosylhydrolase [Actinocatenispora sp.]